MTILSLSHRVRAQYDRAIAEDPDLRGGTLLDWCADRNPRIARTHLMVAILVSGIELVCNDRIRAEIDSYTPSSSA